MRLLFWMPSIFHLASLLSTCLFPCVRNCSKRTLPFFVPFWPSMRSENSYLMFSSWLMSLSTFVYFLYRLARTEVSLASIPPPSPQLLDPRGNCALLTGIDSPIFTFILVLLISDRCKNRVEPTPPPDSFSQTKFSSPYDLPIKRVTPTPKPLIASPCLAITTPLFNPNIFFLSW